jgi:hypothetical protein
MSRIGRVMFLVERTRRTRPNDVATVTAATAEQVSQHQCTHGHWCQLHMAARILQPCRWLPMVCPTKFVE